MPKGYNTLNSPYGRSARVAAIETGQPNIIDRFMSREERAKEVPALNPLGKIPAVVLDDGTLIVDSPVIMLGWMLNAATASSSYRMKEMNVGLF